MVDLSEMKGLFDISGKVAVVTGAGSGIGQAIAYAFAANGGKVMASDKNAEALDRTVREIRSGHYSAMGVEADCTDVSEVKRLKEEAIGAYGRVDVLYAVPGINVRKRIEDYAYDEFDRVVQLNLKGTFILMKEIGTEIAKNREGGSVVVMSSIRASVVEPGQAVYAATKAGVALLAKVQAAELGGRNVRVNALAPGYVDTPLVARIKNDPEWYAAEHPEERPQAVGDTQRDCRTRCVSRHTCGLVHNRGGHLRGRRLDGHRRTVRPQALRGAVTVPLSPWPEDAPGDRRPAPRSPRSPLLLCART